MLFIPTINEFFDILKIPLLKKLLIDLLDRAGTVLELKYI